MAKKIDYSSKTERELNRMLTDQHENLRVFRFGSAGSKTRNVKEGSKIKKEIARLLTEIRLREIRSNSKK